MNEDGKGPPPCDTIFLTDLPPDFDDVQLQASFGAFGTIVWSKLFCGGRRPGALVQYGSVEEAVDAVVNFQETGLTLTARFAEPRGSGHKKSPIAATASAPAPRQRPSPYGVLGGMGQRSGMISHDGYRDARPSLFHFQAQPGPSLIHSLKSDLLAAGALPGGQWSKDKCAVFVGGLPPETIDQDLYAIFATFGAIPLGGVKAMTNPDGSCNGMGFVNFIDPKSVQAAIEALNGAILRDGSHLRVKVKTPPKKAMT